MSQVVSHSMLAVGVACDEVPVPLGPCWPEAVIRPAWMLDKVAL